MNDGASWLDAAKDAKAGHDKYNAIKGKIEKVEGTIADIRKLQSLASSLIHDRAGTSALALSVTFEGMIRLAGRLPTPYLSHYLKLYQPGIEFLAGLSKSSDEAKLALDWSRGLGRSADEFVKGIDAIKGEFSYAGEMVDFDGRPAKHLPAGLKRHLADIAALKASTRDVGRSIQNVDWSKTAQAIDAVGFHLEHAAGVFADVQRDSQDMCSGVVFQAHEIASAHAHFSYTFSKICAAGDSASKTMQRLTTSDNKGENVIGLGTEKQMYTELFERMTSTQSSGMNVQDVQNFAEGNWRKSRDFLRMERAMKDMQKLSSNWSKWAYWAAKGDLMRWA